MDSVTIFDDAERRLPWIAAADEYPPTQPTHLSSMQTDEPYQSAQAMKCATKEDPMLAEMGRHARHYQHHRRPPSGSSITSSLPSESEAGSATTATGNSPYHSDSGFNRRSQTRNSYTHDEVRVFRQDAAVGRPLEYNHATRSHVGNQRPSVADYGCQSSLSRGYRYERTQMKVNSGLRPLVLPARYGLPPLHVMEVTPCNTSTTSSPTSVDSAPPWPTLVPLRRWSAFLLTGQDHLFGLTPDGENPPTLRPLILPQVLIARERYLPSYNSGNNTSTEKLPAQITQRKSILPEHLHVQAREVLKYAAGIIEAHISPEIIGDLGGRVERQLGWSPLFRSTRWIWSLIH